MARRLHSQHIQVSFTEEAVAFLADRGFDPEFGARPLRRTIQRLVENEMSRMLLDGRLIERNGSQAAPDHGEALLPSGGWQHPQKGVPRAPPTVVKAGFSAHPFRT